MRSTSEQGHNEVEHCLSMTVRNARRQLVVAAFAVLGVAAFLGYVLRVRGLATAANVAQLVALLFAVPSLLWPLIVRWRASRRPEVATPARLADVQSVLALLVDAQWRAESRLRMLDDPDPIPVRWHVAGDELMDAPANRTAGVFAAAASDRIEALVDDFRALRRRRLVILGEAGAGKTTLAVQIVLWLLRTRPSHPDEPVPVLLSLTAWAGSPRKQLADW